MSTTRGTPATRTRRALVAAGRMAVLATGLGIAGWVIRTLGLAPGGETGMAWVDHWIRGQGLWGELVFLAAGAAATAVGLPRQAVAFLGGYAFGAAIGTGLALLAQLLGCAASFGWARLLGREWAARRLEGRFGRRLRPLHDRLVANPFGATLALRLLPVGNNLALNLVAGLSSVALVPFLAGSGLGYLPQTLVFALLGDGVAVDRTAQLILGAALFLISVALGVWLLKREPPAA
ncbi:TVP38/TMEM64 family protein [Roseomonas xinghualingensis]|uniref:TVP38/TMEM64 family protein n=1 Tax=Roseomonas xinghualingensis TaxID=2986475 RepID=UPI0021F0A73A|nr:VTT domain-containing protein [Roseomonas sp. SXEYE001]MCV4208806.1 VTT domain-containing protein [Roseomonas sp. SXEYE001]